MISIRTDDPPIIKPPLLNVVGKVIELGIVVAINLTLLPAYLFTTLLYGRPPTVPRLRQAVRYLYLCLTVQSPIPPYLTIRARIYIALLFVIKAAQIPIWGLAWHLDEILYGRALNASSVDIVRPIFVISAGRSGSTQISRYIENDPHVAAPSILHCMFPYLWLWKSIPWTLGRFVTPEYVTEKIKGLLSAEALERHEMDPFKSDTFDAVFWGCHYNFRALALGPDVAYEELHMARIVNQADSPYMENDFGRLIDRIGRKYLLVKQTGQKMKKNETAGCTAPRLFIKGHFLWAANELERRYPDASFLTVVREPTSRIRSGINFMRVQPPEPAMGPAPWMWLSTWVRRCEVDYCNIEMEWYSRGQLRKKSDDAGSSTVPIATRCAVSFDDFKADIEMTMKKVYTECGLTTGSYDSGNQVVLPPHMPHEHTKRRRSGYAVDKSLEDLGIDEDELKVELGDYIAWCKSISTSHSTIMVENNAAEQDYCRSLHVLATGKDTEY
mmetsp:Transcript_19361/g.43013  ORF Transcript_19361/g.43013 Transcript_19361/m.43013 type:complete len:499 (+) Transcript_19361:227-1723(+)